MKVNIGQVPSIKGKIIRNFFTERGSVPVPYRYMAMEKGWMKIKCGNKIGYVHSELVKWLTINTY